MNTVKSFWLGWGSLCVAGGGAFYFAKKQINIDRQAKVEAHRRKRQNIEEMQNAEMTAGGNGNGSPARTDSAGSPSQEASSDPAPTRHAPMTEAQRVAEKSKYESSSSPGCVAQLTTSYAIAVSNPLSGALLFPFFSTMATPEVAIARATLSATLFRADPTSLSRQQVDAFFPLLTSALAQCSRPNVQKCKAWIVDHIAPSGARTAALAKFLAALSKNFQDDGERPSVKRRRLHVLYVLSDVLHHVVKRNGNATFATAWDGVLPELMANAAAFVNCPKHKKKLEGLINLWEEKGYINPDVISKLREALANGITSTPATEPQPSSTSVKLAKDQPYVLPSFHGDPSTPWYDLPAGTWLPHLIPNSTKAMLPDLIRPLQLAPGPADKALAAAVRNLLSDVERLFSKERKPEDDALVDVNELGERIVLDEITGEIIGGETYYGWSRQFCEKMKDRKRRKKRGSDRGRSRSRSSSYSRGRSRSSSPPNFKRRRASADSGSRNRSRSPSRTPDRRFGTAKRRRSYSRSSSRSRSPSRPRRYSRSPPPSIPPPPPAYPTLDHRPPIPQQIYAPPPNFPPALPPSDFLVPPPPPMGYQGPWPPPPMGGPPQGWYSNPGWAQQHPPPPPPQNYVPQQNSFARGSGGFRGRGRGGYDRGGRGGW
ncbi:hypothetical protein G7046_g751 [Stylonectria norvegica]|nr:hypothetical protein G7046_g751 [Stylonectria norvegica]